jgi:hypothetical protein
MANERPNVGDKDDSAWRFRSSLHSDDDARRGRFGHYAICVGFQEQTHRDGIHGRLVCLWIRCAERGHNYSDGKLGFFYGGIVFDAGLSTQTWNSGSATKEYGNFIQLPFPAKIYGIISASNHAGDADIILYSDPLGTPVAEKTVSVDLNTVLSAANRWAEFLFPAPYSATASQPLAAIVKPTSATNITNQYVTMNSSSHQKSLSCGTNGYAVNRASGAFAAQNSSKDRFNIGLLVGAFDAGGGASAVQYRPSMSGNV